ncbi:MAG: cupin domain-containing protein [Methylobacteriaceae bacterium]|nr:cupin domain-containing protein [Methylobacteriaceae bacterium]
MKLDPKTSKPHLEFFRVGEDGWTELAPGIQQKILAGGLDETMKRGFLNRLVRWAPGAAIDEVKVHEFYEEVLVVSGELLVGAEDDRTRLKSFPAPSFACRPPGAPHGPFKAGPQGCVLFENQFYL